MSIFEIPNQTYNDKMLTHIDNSISKENMSNPIYPHGNSHHKQFDCDAVIVVTCGQKGKMPLQGTKPGLLQVPGKL